MRSITFCVITLVTLLLSFNGQLHSQEVAKPQFLHLLMKKDGDIFGAGSGTHIGNGLVITAAHVVNKEGGVKDGPPKKRQRVMQPKATDWEWESDGATGKVEDILWVDKERDVALVRISKWEQLKSSKLICKDLQVRETISVNAYPLTLGRLEADGKVTSAPRQRNDTFNVPTVLLDITVAPGMSGGAIIQDDNVVGMVHAFPMFSPTMGAPSITIGTSGTNLCASLNEFEKKI